MNKTPEQITAFLSDLARISVKHGMIFSHDFDRTTITDDLEGFDGYSAEFEEWHEGLGLRLSSFLMSAQHNSITTLEARADVEAEAARREQAEMQCYFIEPRELSDEDRRDIQASMCEGRVVALPEGALITTDQDEVVFRITGEVADNPHQPGGA